VSGIASGLAAAAGAGLCVLALAWWAVARRRAWVRLARALAAEDPATKLAALALLADRGIRGYTALLRWRIAVEEDPLVLDRIAEVILADRWGPSTTAELVELRLWARRRTMAESAAQPEPMLQTDWSPIHRSTLRPVTGQADRPPSGRRT
jgi:hypothetical protein